MGYGEYGVNSTTFNQIGSSQWMDINTGYSTMCLIDNNYNLYFIGGNNYNQFGMNYIGTFPYKYPTLYNDIRMIIFEADYPDKCDYDLIKNNLSLFGFTKIIEGPQNVWIKIDKNLLARQKGVKTNKKIFMNFI